MFGIFRDYLRWLVKQDDEYLCDTPEYAMFVIYMKQYQERLAKEGRDE